VRAGFPTFAALPSIVSLPSAQPAVCVEADIHVSEQLTSAARMGFRRGATALDRWIVVTHAR